MEAQVVEAQKKAAHAIDPLWEASERAQRLAVTSEADIKAVMRPDDEPGSTPLKNARQERFCEILTGWGGDGEPQLMYVAYQAVYGQRLARSTAKVSASRLLARQDVRQRVEWMRERVAESGRQNARAVQTLIDTFRIGLIERATQNSKLAALALSAAKDYENAHGLLRAGGTESTQIAAAVETSSSVMGSIATILAKVTRKD